MGLHAERGVLRQQALAGHLQLRPPDVAAAVEHLALEVREIDHVGVDEAEGPDARRGQVQRRRAAEPAHADDDDARRQQLRLSLGPDLGQVQVAAVALELLRTQRRTQRGHPERLSDASRAARRRERYMSTASSFGFSLTVIE